MRGSEQRSDAETVGIFLVSDPRLLQQRVQFLPDVRLHLVMTIALCERRGELLRKGRRNRARQGGERHMEVISIEVQGHICGQEMMESRAVWEQRHKLQSRSSTA